MKQLSRIFVASALILSTVFVIGSCGPKEGHVPVDGFLTPLLRYYLKLYKPCVDLITF